MSEQQNEADEHEPSEQRKAELHAAYSANSAAGKPPFLNIAIANESELQWLLREFGSNQPIDLSFVILRGANLQGVNLEGAVLQAADLRLTNFRTARLRGADLRKAALSGTDFTGADLREAQLSYTLLDHSLLRGADVRGAFMVWTRLVEVDIGEADLGDRGLVRTNLSGACLQNADLSRSHLEEVDLSRADLRHATLSSAILAQAVLTGTDLRESSLYEADLRGARLDALTRLDHIGFTSGTLFADVVWNSAPLTGVEWVRERRILLLAFRHPRMLGDELAVKAIKGWRERATAYMAAARAYSGLATAMRSQGLVGDADLFAYQAKVLQRRAQWLQLRWPQALGSWILDLISGYGYRPIRSFITYALVILAFAAAYLTLGGANGKPLSWNEAIVVSMTAFHGRGFFAAVFQPGDLQAAVAAVEAFVGLLIEIVFIATFTQRFFAR